MTKAQEYEAFFCEVFNRETGKRLVPGGMGRVERMSKLIKRWPSITKEDIELVVIYINAQWGDDDRMKKYIRPSTILKHGSGATTRNFADYLDEARDWAEELV